MFDDFQFAVIHGPDIPGSYAILLFTASDLASITSHIHSWVFFLPWLLLELTPQKDVLFIIGDCNAKVGSQETPGVKANLALQYGMKQGKD